MYIFTRINTLLDEHVPNLKLSIKEISLKAKPWINYDRVLKRYCNENNPTLKVARHSKYKSARKLVIFKMKKIKKESYKNYFQRCSKNVKKTWGGIKSIVTLKFKDKISDSFFCNFVQ